MLNDTILAMFTAMQADIVKACEAIGLPRIDNAALTADNGDILTADNGDTLTQG